MVLTLTQSYYICLLDNDCNFPKTFKPNAILLISCMIELYLNEIIVFEDDNSIKINKELSNDYSYAKPIYDYLNKKGVIKLTSLFAHFTLSLGKYKKQIKPLLIDSLPKKIDSDEIIDNLRTEILDEPEINLNTGILCMLLYHSKTLDKFFSSNEQEILNKKLEEIKKRPEYKEFQRINDLLSKK